jgi:hypothetical protein
MKLGVRDLSARVRLVEEILPLLRPRRAAERLNLDLFRPRPSSLGSRLSVVLPFPRCLLTRELGDRLSLAG